MRRKMRLIAFIIYYLHNAITEIALKYQPKERNKNFFLLMVQYKWL